MEKMFYVYEWYIVDRNCIIYVGKGIGDRYKAYTKKNESFKNFVKLVNCDVRIIKYFDDEKDAFNFERERIQELRLTNQCIFNKHDGGTGGCSDCWTDEKRLQYSKNNVMKSEKQRERMKINNPMKNKEIASRQHESKKKAIYLNNVYYKSTVDAAKELRIATNTVLTWLKLGHDSNGNPCKYDGQEQKPYSFEKKISCSKKVWVEDTLFSSVKNAAGHLNTTSDNLIKFLKKNKAYKGISIRYDNQQPS